MQLQHNLSIQQQELIQQLQLVQRQYLIHQGLVKPLHLDFQTQLQTVLTPAPVRTIGDKELFGDQNVRMSEKSVDLDNFYTVGHRHNNNNNNNNNNNSYCNSKSKKLFVVPMKEEIQSEDSENPIKIEYATENYIETNVTNAAVHPSCSSDNVIRTTGEDLAQEDEELEDEDEVEKSAETQPSKSSLSSVNENFQPPWPTRMETIGRSSAFSSDDNDDNNNIPNNNNTNNNDAANDEHDKRGSTRIYVSNGNTRLSKRRVSTSASMSPPRHGRLRAFLSPTDALGVVPQMNFYGMAGQPYRFDDILSPNEGLSGMSNNYHQQSDHELNATKQYFHPLFVHGVCRWPGCELALDDVCDFVKHLNTEHSLDDRSTAQARVQMQVVSQLEIHLQKERDRLQAMMHHLYLTKQQFAANSNNKEANISNTATSSIGTSPHSNSSQQNISDSGTVGAIQNSILNSNISAIRKRISDKSPLSLAGGLPYMLERAGLDVQQEIQRNREFYKNADVRPPFTYASLIRQSIIESPDKQLTLNEIYNWFQNTFCYFRRNAATWKNAIRTNLSLHKCFVRYEDDFGSFWMVDDSEFVKRRHLSRGRPRKYEPSSSPNSNSNSQQNSRSTSNSSGQKIANVSGEETFHMKGNNNNNNKNSSTAGNGDGDNDGFDICAGSQRNSSNNKIKHPKTNSQINKNSLSQPNSNAELGISPNLIDGFYQTNYHQQQTQNLAHDSNGNFSPSLQNIWPCSPPSFDDGAASAAAALSFGSTYRHHYRHHESFRQQMQQQQNSQRLSQHDFRLFQQQQLPHQQSFQHHQRQHIATSNCNDSFSSIASTYITDKPCHNMAFKLEHQQYQRLSAPNSNERLEHSTFYSSNIQDANTVPKTSPEEHANDQRDENDDSAKTIFKQPTRNSSEISDNEAKK